MAEWNYGDAYKEYPLTDDPYIFDDGSIVQVHDIFKQLPKFMYDADVMFIDPPWNKGNMTSFYTKAGMINDNGYEAFCNRIFECIGEIHPRICFVEIGKEYLADFIIRMRKLYKYVTFYNSTYYKKKDCLCYIVQGSNKRQNHHLDGMDEEDIIKWITENINYTCIGDLCMGRGLVAYYSSLQNKNFVGTELNTKRLSVAVKRVRENKL